MADYNKVIIIGKLGDTPSLQQGANGPFTVMRIANNKSFPDKLTGEIIKRTIWHDVMVFGSFSEAIVKKYRVGNEVFIEGELSYVEHDEFPYPQAQIVARFVQLTGGRD